MSDSTKWKPITPPPLPVYEPVSPLDAAAGLVECSICAAVVNVDSRPEHDQWHRRLAAAGLV